MLTILLFESQMCSLIIKMLTTHCWHDWHTVCLFPLGKYAIKVGFHTARSALDLKSKLLNSFIR